MRALCWLYFNFFQEQLLLLLSGSFNTTNGENITIKIDGSTFHSSTEVSEHDEKKSKASNVQLCIYKIL